jgi:hypothetical protein
VTIEVAGVWKDLTDNVNLMASNLTDQLRNIAMVTTAVAEGDLSKKISIEVKGEFLELKNTVNAMVDQLNGFAGEVTRVAREVGVEGKLGGQAQSKEVAGVWKDLTDSVNQLAANLTNQVRAFAEVATAVTDGDLTRQVCVEASGEVADLKDKLNVMIRTLAETTKQNLEQDWLKTNLERLARLLQGQRDLTAVSELILSELAPLVSAQHGVFYSMTSSSQGDEPLLKLLAGYGYEERKRLSTTFRLGDGLVGQCAKEKKRILLTEVPGDYVKINSGLGSSSPLNIIVLPVLFDGTVRAVIELASFSAFSEIYQTFLDRFAESVGLVLNAIDANTLTENLLEQAQAQAEVLRQQREELRESNDDLARQAVLMAEKNSEAELKNQEVEQAKRLLEEKAIQLAVSSRYKSEFIANMSHELRTPLNSLLVLAEQLGDNPDGNLTEAQVEYASVILASGKDLLALFNSILDLAKVESGTIKAEMTEISITDLCSGLRREFEHIAQKSGTTYSIEVSPTTPDHLVTDPRRLRQILKNLLSNAFKFTETGGEVYLRIDTVNEEWASGAGMPTKAPAVTFTVKDTGIGIDHAQQQRIFEAFSQVDGTTVRDHGGTGLGLSISRALVDLLGGAITVKSALGQGSIFTVYHPPGLLPTAVNATVVASEKPAATSGYLSIAVNELETEKKSPKPDRLDRDHGLLSGLKVLVVDDDFRNIFAMTALFERGQADVIAAESGLDAIAALEMTPDIDLVVMGIMKPGMDGFDTIRAIRKLEQFEKLPIVIVTGKAMPDERRRFIDAGANDYVRKPVDTAELVGAMRPWLPTRAQATP